MVNVGKLFKIIINLIHKGVDIYIYILREREDRFKNEVTKSEKVIVKERRR